MAITTNTGRLTLYADGHPIGSVANIELSFDPFVAVMLGGVYADGTEATPVAIEAPQSVVQQGAQAVFDWWLADLEQKESEAPDFVPADKAWIDKIDGTQLSWDNWD